MHDIIIYNILKSLILFEYFVPIGTQFIFASTLNLQKCVN